MLSESIRRIPKVDFHVHLEGTIRPSLVKKLAAKNKIEVPAYLLDGDGTHFYWQDDGTPAGALKAFLAAYDAATSVLRGADDYAVITHEYLLDVAAEGCIYAEVFISADHGKLAGLSYPAMLAGIEQGYRAAREKTGIEMRLLSTCVRHYGPAAALEVAEITRKNPHPLVTGFSMAGDENAYTPQDFLLAFETSGLKRRSAHAGEAAGPQSVRAARECLKIKRFGHMVRAAEDPVLLQEQKAWGAVPEICVSSNMALKVFERYEDHPLRKFFDSGLKVTLGSDDPAFFNTSIGREYEIAHRYFGFSDEELLQLSKNAIEAAFIDEKTRGVLLEKLAV